MERRLFLTGLLGVAGTAGIAAILPRQALATVPMGPITPDHFRSSQPERAGTRRLSRKTWMSWASRTNWMKASNLPHIRRRRRVRRWRHRCRGAGITAPWRRRCRREPYWHFIWFWI